MPTRELKYYALEEEWQTVLRRAFDLPPADQLKLFHALSEYLGEGIWQESKRARQARQRHEALEAMRAAATYLKLPDGQPPTIPEYKRAAKETDLPMAFAAVYEAFENRWDIAARYYRGERVPETAAQRSHRRRMAGRSSADRETPLAGVRLFLKQDPAPEPTRTNYETWAAEFNQKPPPGYGNVVETGPHITATLGIGWEDVVEVAAGRKELERAQAEALSQALSDAGPLVGHQLASRMLGRSPDARHALKDGYPEPVVRIGKSWLWLHSDIEGWKAGRVFTHQRGLMQDQYVDVDELAQRLGISPASLRSRVYAELWDRVPRPAGRAGKSLYWARSEVERWFREAPRHVGPLRGGRPRKSVS